MNADEFGRAEPVPMRAAGSRRTHTPRTGPDLTPPTLPAVVGAP